MMRGTIRHDGTSRSIVAYLAAVRTARTAKQITRYIDLMHFVTDDSTRHALKHLSDSGAIEKVRRGMYRRRWDVAA